MSLRIGSDVGGTFTDVFSWDPTSESVSVGKALTTRDPELGVSEALLACVPDGAMRTGAQFLHGTTVALNALLERTGGTTAILATDGFRDVLELRRGDRQDMYDLGWKPPPPLIPRRLRWPVRERVRADGEIMDPLRGEDVLTALEHFQAEGAECIAIAFINAYANPAHELTAESILLDAGFEGEISLSHRVSGEFREYERTSTTAIDAYIRPRTGRYLDRVENVLEELNVDGERFITNSGGGVMTFEEARERPFETTQSGPAAGAAGAAELAQVLGTPHAVAVDVGGTSFDASLIVDGQPQVRYEGAVVGMPLQTRWVDVRSIGAGGGSIAYIDETGLLRVGPRSAGALPGPVCYASGGTEPTVTDAAALLGMLGMGRLAGGVALDTVAAARSLESLGRILSLDVDSVARGVLHIASANMSNLIHEMMIERGLDAREFSLIAFGGAGPLFARLLASELETPKIIIPAFAGVFSAWSLLQLDMMRSASTTWLSPLAEDTPKQAQEHLRNLARELAARVHGAAETDIGDQIDLALDLRFVGQEYTVAVPVTQEGLMITDSADRIRQAFIAAYEGAFSHTIAADVEVVAIRATLRATQASVTAERSPAPQGHDSALTDGTVPAYSFSHDRREDFTILERAALPDGGQVSGPAIIREETSTTYLDAGYEAKMDASQALIIRRSAEAS